MPALWRLDLHRLGEERLRISLSGRWLTASDLPRSIPEIAAADSIRAVEFDAEGLEAWDSGMLAFIDGVLRTCTRRNITADLGGLPAGAQRLLAIAQPAPERDLPKRRGEPKGFLAQIGTASQRVFGDLPQMLRFLGQMCLSLLRLLRGRARFRLRDLWLEIEEVGPRALPIVSVISFLVGLILAYLGADQLRLVGAQVFIADLVAIGMVREIGALMTGIIIAGRTGAAFAARLGTMQVNEEIDAFETLGIDAIDFLVLPRVLALLLMMPLLTLYAGFIGMLAGMVVSVGIFDISAFAYYTETLRALHLKHFLVGLSKGTVYGAVIAFSGCLRGMQCGRSAAAVGRATTSAVVTAILLITIVASIMTIVYYQLDI